MAAIAKTFWKLGKRLKCSRNFRITCQYKFPAPTRREFSKQTLARNQAKYMRRDFEKPLFEFSHIFHVEYVDKNLCLDSR